MRVACGIEVMIREVYVPNGILGQLLIVSSEHL